MRRRKLLAANQIGFMYAWGQGVAQDYGEAMRWFRLAADRGNAVAMNNIGELYAKGQGVFRRIASTPDDGRTTLLKPGSKSQNNTFYQGSTVNVIGSGRQACLIKLKSTSRTLSLYEVILIVQSGRIPSRKDSDYRATTNSVRFSSVGQ